MVYNGKILMLLPNNYFMKDVRVWSEAILLTENNWKVLVISQGKPEEKRFEVIKGISIYRFPELPAFYSIIGYGFEFFYSSLVCFLFSLYVLFKEGFDIIHAHNPPDTLVFIGLFYKLLDKQFIFDHHDLTAELYCSKFSRINKAIYETLLLLERFSCKIADLVITTNKSYKNIEIQRDKISSKRIFIVRNGPALDIIKPYYYDVNTGTNRNQIIVYAGRINKQDGVDYFLRAVKFLIYNLDKKKIHIKIIGDGDALHSIKVLANQLQINNYIAFTGWLSQESLMNYLSAADICVSPEPSNPLNDKSTFIKIMEYMALGKPVVSFDLLETRFSAQNAAVYAKPNDERDFAKKIVLLMDNSKLRKKMGEFGRKRVEKELAWECVSKPLLQAYNSLRTR